MSDGYFKTFVMSETTERQIETLPENLQLKFYRAVSRFGLYGEEPVFEGLEYTVWVGIRDLIAFSKRRDDDWRERQRALGKSGAAKRWKAGQAADPPPPEIFPPESLPPAVPPVQVDSDPISGDSGYSENGDPISSDSGYSENGDPISSDSGYSADSHNDKYNDKYNENLQIQTQVQENQKNAAKPPGMAEVKPPFVFFSRLQKKELRLTLPQREDAQAKWNIAVEVWNELTLDPRCRDIIIPPAERESVVYELGKYTCAEVLNAVGNLSWHRFDAGADKYKPPPPYGSLMGFIRSGGVGRYVDDKALDSQFLISGKAAGG